MQEADTLQRFLFENSNIRGILVHLRASYQTTRERYEYPDAVASQLGQTLTASVLLGATIKFQGSLIMQIQSQGPINMLVAQCTHDRHIRGLARWQGEIEGDTLGENYGEGRIVITIAGDKFEDRYQGIIGLEGRVLAEALEHYFVQSEQLDTRLFLVADNQQAVGMLLQRLPGERGREEDESEFWHHIEALGSTITSEEMLQLESQEILHRLFHEEDVRLFDPEPVSFRCTCSREKITGMLRSLGLDEARQIVQDEGSVHVSCEFCNHQYDFDSVDVEEIFASDIPPPSTDTKQ